MFFNTKAASEQHVAAQRAAGAGKSRRRQVPSNPYYDALIRRLQSIGDGVIGNGPRAIGITSCQRGEGVTTVALNLTQAITKCISDPILLIDANAGSSALSRMMKAHRCPGLANVLAGEASAFDCVVESSVEGISLMPHGKLANGRQPAYDAASIDETLDSIKHVFPLIIIDLPPANELTACLALAGKLDGVVMVVEANRVDTDAVCRAKQQLQTSGANLLGVVLNKQRS